jgi:hypothetical protein
LALLIPEIIEVVGVDLEAGLGEMGEDTLFSPRTVVSPTSKEVGGLGGGLDPMVAMQLQQMVLQSQTAMMQQLQPMFDFVKQTSLEKSGAATAKMEADQAVKEQAAVAQARAVAVAAVEATEAAAAAVARTAREEEDQLLRSFLPNRSVTDPQASEARLRGGAQRLGARQQGIERLLVEQGGLSAEQGQRCVQLLQLGQQVPPSSLSGSPFQGGVPTPAWSLRGVGGGGVEGGLFAELQAAGLAPAAGANAAELALRRLLKKDVEKEVKSAATPASYPDFVAGWRKMGKMTRDTLETDPASYWAMTWHHQSVEHVYLQHGWPVAAEYHRLVLDLWSEKFIDASSHVDTELFRKGNVKLAMHRDSYHEAARVKASSGKGVGKGAGAGAGGGKGGAARQLPYGGTKGKDNSDDTWCQEHACWFPKSANHKWSWVTKEGTCTVAKAKLASKP